MKHLENNVLVIFLIAILTLKAALEYYIHTFDHYFVFFITLGVNSIYILN